MARTDVGRCPACGLGVSVGVMELEGSEPSGDTRLERFTCGHRIAGPIEDGIHEQAVLRRLVTRTVSDLRSLSRRGLIRMREAIGLRVRDEVAKIKR